MFSKQTHLTTGRCEKLHEGLDAHMSVIVDQICESRVSPVLPEDHILPVGLNLHHVVTTAIGTPVT